MGRLREARFCSDFSSLLGACFLTGRIFPCFSSLRRRASRSCSCDWSLTLTFFRLACMVASSWHVFLDVLDVFSLLVCVPACEG